MKKTKEQYTKVSDKILSSNKLTPSQKLMISYVLRWQSSGKVCFESNKSLAKRFGLALSAIKKQITELNKLPFFESKESSGINDFGKWSNSKEMKVDIDALQIFLNSIEESTTPVDEIKVDENKDFNDYETFKEFVDHLTEKKMPEEKIKYYFDLMPQIDIIRNVDSITHTFKEFLSHSISPPLGE